ncbi:DEAD/DEAH box helicase [Agrobacterium sp. ES01]|uniref:DEAD/DEAH box helicase n=1 Tax=Agrobacterium sp. ES01 TaxID=3420714 RepID=UPI003D0ED268
MIERDGLAPPIAAALAKRGYDALTPVQEAMLDPELITRDALVSAQTGSGKTVAFGLALAPTLLGENGRFGRAEAPLALAIAPTRELALQVKRELDWLYGETGAEIASCVGGMDPRSERRALERGTHIIVGTPGRLRDHITRRALDLSNIRAVVLDEADEMLDLGFREDLEFILEASPDARRTLMFSATVPKAIADLARNFQRDAVRIKTAAEQKQHIDIEYRALISVPSDKENSIINALRYYEAKNAIVFCSTRANVNHLTSRLSNRGFSVVALSGELSQNERTHALQAMRDGRARVCIATDVAARGIDLPGLELVIHADLPTNSESLLHRSGRTGRAGNKGISALIVPVNQRRKAERLLAGAKVDANWANPPSADEVIARDQERMMGDTSLSDAILDDERNAVAALTEQFSAEQLAVAFARLYRGNRSAPEDIAQLNVQAADRKPRERGEREPRDFGESRPRDQFGPSRWFSISVGRRQSAEPRWLIPMLCRHGKISKSDIGAIKLQAEESFVEIAEDSLDRFVSALGPNKTLERGITVTELEGTPDFSASPKGPKRRDDWSDKKGDRGDFKKRGDDRKPREFKKDGERFEDRKPAAARHKGDDLRATDNDVWGDAAPKPAKRSFNEGDAKPARAGKPGDKPFARKKDGDKPRTFKKDGDKPFAKKGKPPNKAR